MAAVHTNNTNPKDNQQQQQRNGTTSPSGWHFPKSGLGTPDLFYSFSGGASSSGGNQHNGPTMASSSSSNNVAGSSSTSGTQPAWFKPQGVSTGKKETSQAANTSSSSAAIKKEEPDDGDDDADARNNAGESSNAGNQNRQAKDNTGNEEANRNVRALSDPPVRQSPAWIFPAAGFGPHKTHLEQEPNPFEHSFSSRPEDSHSNLQFAQAINAGNHNAATGPAGANAGQGYNAGYPSNAYMNAGHVGGPSAGIAVGGGGNNQYEIGPPRRARSQSPKSAGWQHSSLNPQRSINNSHFNSAFPDNTPSSYLGNNLFAAGNNGKGNTFGNISTPSSELPSFGWTFDGTGSHHGHAGAGPSNLANNNNSNSGNSNGIFDPTSIRTGLTPGVSDAKHNTNNPPHSPATQALFAMMTNATPGGDIAAHFGSSSSNNAGTSKGQPSNLSLHPTALGDVSRGSSHSSNSSISQVPQQHGHNNVVNPQGVYSQALPRPMQTQGPPYSQQQQQQQHLHSSYQGGNPNYLQQNVPRPFPSSTFDSTQSSSQTSSSQSVPQLHHQSQRPGEHNPLYLLSQHAQDGSGVPPPPHLQQHQQHPSGLPPNAVQRLQPQGMHARHPSDTQTGVPSSSHNEDAMLAAAALSGLSTPRPAYVGGPSPLATVNPGTINPLVPTLVQPPPGRVKPIPPPANLFHEQKPSALTKENMKANNARAGSAAATSKKGGAGTNKRKKGNTATPEPSNAGDDSKSKVRRTSRRTTTTTAGASTSQQQQFTSEQQSPDNNGPDEIEQRYLPGGGDAAGTGLHGDMGDSDDEDMMSNNGSLNGSREGMGGSQAGDGSNVSPPRKGGRGPKQHFATEEEKRKNFLERNRQAALKCRQRKKQWLGSLQSKVEYLTADNETLHTTVRRLREEAASLRAILGAHSDCQLSLPSGPGGPGGVTTVGAYLHGVQQQQQGPPLQQQHQY